jgi:hypothetical protein
MLVPVRNYNTLTNLSAVLDRIDPRTEDAVVLHLRFVQQAGAGESELEPEQLFSIEEQTLFTRALELAEKKGKSIHLAVAAATDKWDAILRAANSLRSSSIVLGASPNSRPAEDARLAGLAWERLPSPRPTLSLRVVGAQGREDVFLLGPHAPQLTAKEIDLLHGLWLDLSAAVAPDELHHRDIVAMSLQDVAAKLSSTERPATVARLRRYLQRH